MMSAAAQSVDAMFLLVIIFPPQGIRNFSVLTHAERGM
jgi:hypothetical protein